MSEPSSKLDIHSGAQKTSYGGKYLPLLSKEPANIIPDKLHLFMRIFDFRMRNLFDDVIDKDDRAKVRKEQCGYFDSLVKGIRDCGENVSVWSIKGRGDLDRTSMTASEMKRVT